MTSILDTQHRLDKVKQEVRIAEEVLATVKTKLDEATEAHRTQIAKSLLSKDPAERRMAEGVANWWEVPKPSSSSSKC